LKEERIKTHIQTFQYPKKISRFFFEKFKEKKKKSNFHWALSRVDSCENSVLLTLELAATPISSTPEASIRTIEGTEKLL
jgi:hypothetical protein